MDDFLAEAKEVAVKAAKEAGALLLKDQKGSLKISIKGGNMKDIVTNADVESEAIICKRLAERFPDCGMICEESRPIKGNSYTWYIDPLDGTTNYSHGSDYFCISIGLAKGSELLVAVIYRPTTGELYTAVKGNGAFLNGKRLGIKGAEQLRRALICTDISNKPGIRTESLELLNKLAYAKSIRIKGSGCLVVCEIVTGLADGLVSLAGGPWDFAAAALIAKEAGGMATALDGKEWTPEAHHGIVIANKALNKALVEMLKL